MMIMRALFCLFLPLAATACGFQPVYGTSASIANSPLQIDEIPGRAGHELREALILESRNGLPGMPASGGNMVVQLEETILSTGFRSDGSAFRATMRLDARYIVDLGETALQGEETAEFSYDVPNAPFADVAVQNDAAQRVASDLARKIVDDLIFQLDTAG